MITEEQREKAFREDFKELLSKHGADMDLEDKGRNYMPEIYINISMMSIFDGDGEITHAYCEFEL